MAAAPHETLRSLDSRESTWEAVGPLLVEAGYSISEATAHLAAHAPTAEAFATGVTAIEDDPVTAFSAVTRRVQPEDVAALSERYGLSPEQTAAALASAMVPTEGLAVGVLGVDPDVFSSDVELTPEIDVGNAISI